MSFRRISPATTQVYVFERISPGVRDVWGRESGMRVAVGSPPLLAIQEMTELPGEAAQQPCGIAGDETGHPIRQSRAS
jgi:hypothetical protein